MSQALFHYRIRISRRARRVRLRVSVHGGLEVILPAGHDASAVPPLLERHRAWIGKALQRAERQRQLLGPQLVRDVPERITFSAVNRCWSVVRRETAARSVNVREIGSAELLLVGAIESEPACRNALARWLVLQASEHLLPQLNALSARTGLAYRGVTVRRQRTRWGSCSHRRTISLNAKLMFLAPELVDYVLIHELCHTAHMNHSERFWNLVGRYCPDYRLLDRQLRDVWKVVPFWAG